MTLVIYDSMRSYSTELVRYLSRKNREIHAAAFFEKEELDAYLNDHVPDALLAAEALADEDIRKRKCGRLILLSESAETIPEPEAGSPARIGRYQSADEILSEILVLCSETLRADPEQLRCGSGAVMTAFYAPAACPAYSELVRQYAREKRCTESVLYLNLSENAGFTEQYQRSYKRDLSDLLFMSMHSSSDPGLLIKGMVCEDDGLEYIPPMEQPVNAFLISEKEWYTFLKRLQDQSGYDRIVFELGPLFPGAYEILRICEEVCLVTQETRAQRNSMRHFLRIYEKRFGSEAMRKLKEIRLPGTEEV